MKPNLVLLPPWLVKHSQLILMKRWELIIPSHTLTWIKTYWVDGGLIEAWSHSRSSLDIDQHSQGQHSYICYIPPEPSSRWLPRRSSVRLRSVRVVLAQLCSVCSPQKHTNCKVYRQSTQWDHIYSENVSHRMPSHISSFNPDSFNRYSQNEYPFPHEFLLFQDKFLMVCHISISCTSSPFRMAYYIMYSIYITLNVHIYYHKHIEYLKHVDLHTNMCVGLKLRI